MTGRVLVRCSALVWFGTIAAFPCRAMIADDPYLVPEREVRQAAAKKPTLSELTARSREPFDGAAPVTGVLAAVPVPPGPGFVAPCGRVHELTEGPGWRTISPAKLRVYANRAEAVAAGYQQSVTRGPPDTAPPASPVAPPG